MSAPLQDDITFPPGDYVSPGLQLVRPDAAFPNMILGDKSTCRWQWFRRDVPHNWYVDRRAPQIGFVSRDEAHILYNSALQFRGKRGLEIGCWLGWSAVHLALGGAHLDVIDPILNQPGFRDSVAHSIHAARVSSDVHLVAGVSPQLVGEVAQRWARKWSLIFIDGEHEAPGPRNDAIAVEPFAENDAMVLFHDLAAPAVADGLGYYRERGWNTLVYQTMQIMGVAWRGNVQPVHHIPDPNVSWSVPQHLQGYEISA